MRKFYWYFTAYVKKHGVIFVFSLLAAITFFSFVLPTLATTLEKGDRFYIGIIGDYSINALPDIIADQLSIGLTSVTEDGSVIPTLAERWTIEQEGKAYRFVLKNNLLWQDGTPIKPEDIQYNLSDTNVAYTANDVVFQLPDNFAPFPSLVSKPLFKTEYQKKWGSAKKPMLIGIGKYKLLDYTTKGNRLVEVIVDSSTARYIYRFYRTENDAILAFKGGEVDLLLDLVKQHDIYEWPQVKTTPTTSTNKYLAVFFNTRDPLFSKNVRQAFSYAITKPTGIERAISPIDSNSWAYLPGGKSYDKDWERGIERLIDEPPQQPLEFELTTTPVFEDKAEIIKTELEAFGEAAAENCASNKNIDDKILCDYMKAKVKIKISNFPDTTDFQMLLIAQESPSDPDQYYLWHSDQSTNFTGYKNTRIDNLLEKGRKTFNQAERKEIYQEFQQFLLEDPPAIFLEHLTTYQVSR